MEPITGLVFGAVAGIVVVPFVLIYCTSCDKKEAEEPVREPPQLTSLNKTASLGQEGETADFTNGTGSKKQNGSHKEHTDENGTTPNESAAGDTVIVNMANIDVQPENTAGSQISVNQARSNTYEELDNVRGEAVTVAMRDSSSTQRSTQSVIIVSDRSHNSQTSRNSYSYEHTRITSQDRALPEIPPVPPGGPPSAPDESPSNRRLLPELPFDPDGDPYDHLDRTIPPQHIKPKSASSKKSKVKSQSPPTVAASSMIQAAGSSEPLYQEAGSESGGVIYARVGEDEGEIEENKTEAVVKKKVDGYTVVKKQSAGANYVSAPTQHSSTETEEDPYSEPPPVPDKRYDLNDIGDQAGSSTQGNEADTAGANTHEHSGSDYYSALDYAGLPPPQNPFPLDQPAQNEGSGDSYDVLSAREPLATVRARALRQSTNDEDYCYVEMDDSQRDRQNGASNAPPSQQGTSDVYAEIDNNPQRPLLGDDDDYSTVANPALPSSIFEEEDYAECGNPDPPPTQPVFQIKVTEGADSENESGSGYATVNYQPPNNATSSGERPPIGSVNPIAAASEQPSTSGSTWQRPPTNHVYQEINEVKKSKKPAEKKKSDKSS